MSFGPAHSLVKNVKGLTSLSGKGHHDVVVELGWYRYDRKREMDFIAYRTACFDVQSRKLEWDVIKIYKAVDSA